MRADGSGGRIDVARGCEVVSLGAVRIRRDVRLHRSATGVGVTRRRVRAWIRAGAAEILRLSSGCGERQCDGKK